MYAAISVRKFVKNEQEARRLVDDVRERLADINEIEITGQFVCNICHETPNPCPQPTEGD